MNLEREIRDGYLVSTEMKKVWAVQIELLKKLLIVCEKYGLRIFADGGTLLGTVRHKGYIPWDDDIDMVMLRPDYDKLVSVATKEFDHPYFFQCGYTEKLYPRGHAQLRMDGTTAILPLPAFVDTHQGVFIDIFPYDAVPDDEKEVNRQIEERNKLLEKMVRSTAFDWFHPFRSMKLLKYKSKFGVLYKEYEDLFRKFKLEDCKNVSCFSFQVLPEKFLRDKHWYDETIFMPFEDIIMPVPIGYHEMLTKQYGDYMVPVKASSYHGGFWKLNADVDYHDYLPELKCYLRAQKVQRTIQRIQKKVILCKNSLP